MTRNFSPLPPNEREQYYPTSERDFDAFEETPPFAPPYGDPAFGGAPAANFDDGAGSRDLTESTLRRQDYVWLFLLAFSVLEPFFDISRFPLKSFACVLVAGLAFACAAMSRFATSFEKPKIGWALLLLYTMVWTFVSGDPDTTYTILNVAALLAFAIKPRVAVAYKLQKWLVALGVVLAISCVVHAFAPSILYSVGGLAANAEWFEAAHKWESHGVYCGLTNQTGATAMLIVLAIVAHFCLMAQKKVKTRDYALLALMLYGVVLTGKRAMFVLAIFSVLFYWNATTSRKMKTWTTLLTIAVASIYLVAPFIAANFSEVKVIERLNATSNDNFYSEREYLTSQAIRLGTENPVFGVGWGRFAELSGTDMGAHNVYLQLFAECGLVGLGLFLVLALGTLIYTRMRLKIVDGVEKRILLFAYLNQLIFLLYSFTGNPFYIMSTRNVYFFACMIALTASLVDRPGSGA